MKLNCLRSAVYALQAKLMTAGSRLNDTDKKELDGLLLQLRSALGRFTGAGNPEVNLMELGIKDPLRELRNRTKDIPEPDFSRY